MALLWKWPRPALSSRRGGGSPDPISPVAGTPAVNEYEDRYPDAYGHGEETPPPAQHRHYTGGELPRQVRDYRSPLAEDRADPPVVVNIQQPTIAEERAALRRPSPRHVERPRRPLVERTPRDICDDVSEQLNASPFIDASGIAISVDGSEVTLEGTINSLIAVSLAQALASNVPGVSRVQVQLRVQPASTSYTTVVPADSDFLVRKG